MRRVFAIFMIVMVLSWTTLPAIAMATWLKAGSPITGTKPITHGGPLKAGAFIAPGEVITGGSAINGVIPNISGQAIIPIHAKNSGLFLIPNTMNGTEYGNWLESTTVITAGDAITGGTSPNGGEAPTGGTAPSGGQDANSGDTISGGEGPNGGQAGTGGEGPNGGQAGTGGEGPNGGQVGTGGEGPNGGQVGIDGRGPTIENETNTEIGSTKEETNGGQNLLTTRTLLVTIPGYLGQMLDGHLARHAGFQLKSLNTANGNKNLYSIEGRAKVVQGNGKIATWLNNRYSNYLNSFENRRAVVRGIVDRKPAKLDEHGNKIPPKKPEYIPRAGETVKQKKLTGFLKEISFRGQLNKEVKNYLQDNWIPIKDKKINFSFFKKDTFLKGNGIANIVLSGVARAEENYHDPSRTKTDFAAGVTTDVMLGIGQTAASVGVGAFVSSIATSAMAGSVVPGIGTLAGAATGLGIAIFLNTPWGRRVSTKVEAGVKWTFEKAKDLGRGLFKKLGWGS